MELSKYQVKTGAWIFVAYAVLCITVSAVERRWLPVGMIWNLFLAILPLVFSQILLRDKSKKPWRKILWFFLWLILFPNALYFVTDFIHLPSFHVNYNIQGNYQPNIEFYQRLIVIATGFIFATFAAIRSLYDVHKIILKSKFAKFSPLFLIAIFSLTGLGIYLGRFLRFNSWDIVRPWSIITQFFNRISLNGLIFIALITIFSAFIYLSFYYFYKKRK